MYVVERWLARLSRSEYADDFVLKGGMLLAVFGTRRPTVDADALARNMPSDHDLVARRVIDIAMLGDLDGVGDLGDHDDGVEFLPETISTSAIRDSAAYSGIRVTMGARLATAQVKLRQANTRVRDFVDIYLLTGTQAVNCGTLRLALNATATFRGVQLTPLADATRGLGSLRASNYAAFRRGLGAVAVALPEQFSDTTAAAVAFIDPVIDGVKGEAEWDASRRRWT